VFPSGLQIKILYTFLVSPICVTCLAHLIHLDLTTVIIFHVAYKLWRSSLCSLLQPPATTSLLGTNILLSALFSNTLTCVLPLVWETKLHTHIKQHKTTGKTIL
jgi:hypothetical protein